MTGLFLFTLIFIIAHFFEKTDYDRMKEAEKLQEAEQYYNEIYNHKSEKDDEEGSSCWCDDGMIICPGCDGVSSKFSIPSGVCAGCHGKGKVTCGKCGGNDKTSK